VVAEPVQQLDDDQLPALYQAQSARSAVAQRDVLNAVKLSLGGALGAAALGVFEYEIKGVDLPALAASIGFLLSLVASSWLLWRRPEREWYDARATAESIKTLAWQFAVGGGEFALGNGAESEARTRFVARLREILGDLGGIGTSAAAGESQLSTAMLDLRAAPLDQRQRAYRAGRIEGQRKWYSEKARWNEKRRKIWAAVTVLAQASGLVAGIARAFLGLEVDLLGLAAAFVAAATAWSRTKDYAELAEAYAVTAQEIGLLQAETMPSDEDEWAGFVERAERAFSREHTLWRARKGHRSVG
jgi:SMODS and SLOG-associating 2TM effector domain 3/SMODS and SLOG-associating 2TM effector domain 1